MAAKKLIKISILLVITVLLALPCATVTFADEDDVTVNVKAGFNNIARYGSITPFHIYIENTGESIKGEVQVIVAIDSRSRMIHAVPCVLPNNSTKDILINVPIYTASRDVEIRLVNNREKVIKAVNHSFEKLVPPNCPVLGLLSDDPDVYTEIKGIHLAENTTSGVQTEVYMKTARVAGTTRESEVAYNRTDAEVFQLNNENFPADEQGMECFDYIIVNNFDMSSLSDKQYNALEKWVEKGNSLILIAGPHGGKVCHGLKESLKFFDRGESQRVKISGELDKLVNEELPFEELYISEIEVRNEDIIIRDNGIPLIAARKKGNGNVSVLAFDPFSSPLAEWEHSQLLMEKIIIKTQGTFNTRSTADIDVQNLIEQRMNNIKYLASQVPETRTPPFKILLAVMGIYILIAGPLLYIVLKKKDKRDWSWVVIPVISVIFMAVIYTAGLKTRFTEAVLNSISVINFNQEDDSANVNTSMAVFNNKQGRLKIEYDKDLDIKIDSFNISDYYRYNSYAQQGSKQKPGVIIGKCFHTDTVSYEFYDSPLWEANYLTTSKEVPCEGDIIDSFSLNNGILKVTVNNTTGLTLKKSFIKFGKSSAEIGDLMPDDKKTLKINIEDDKYNKSFDNFLTDWLGPFNPASGKKMTLEMRENNRKRNMLNNIFRQMFDNRSRGVDSKNVVLRFFAFNDSNPGYPLIINDKQPRTYSTNMVYTQLGMNMNKGSYFEFPAGIINPIFFPGKENREYERFSDGYTSGVRVKQEGNYDYRFKIPKELNVEWFRVNWPESMYVNINMASSKTPPGSNNPLSQNKWESTSERKYFIYNYSTSDWDEIESDCKMDEDIYKYIKSNEISVRINIDMDSDGAYYEMLQEPEISLGGVVE